MNKLLEGVKRFQKEVFGLHKKLFSKLAHRQAPHTLFITCSDSRISPLMLTQTKLGEIFILRNAGNIVPEYSAISNGEAATIEFALRGLGIENIVVCGHSNCGAMKAVLDPKLCDQFPALKGWLTHTKTAKEMLDSYPHLGNNPHLDLVIKGNVLAQLDNLQTHPAVAEKLAGGTLNLYLWIYEISTGTIESYDYLAKQFKPLAEAHRAMPHKDLIADDTRLQI